MLDVRLIATIYGIPVYFQRMPEEIRSVSAGILLFTGSADDERVGLPGLYHWFEHVPFRGTVKYPRGTEDLEKPIIRRNGKINAWTNLSSTCFHGTVHISQWQRLMSTLTDLVAQPLISADAVEAERKIIEQELCGKVGSAEGYSSYASLPILFPGHPFGHHPLGSSETLANMDTDTLRRAHRLGYDRSRAQVVVIGNIPEDDLMGVLNEVLALIPDHQIIERHQPAFHGELPWIPSGITRVETEFATSVIRMLFPLPNNTGESAFMQHNMLMCMRLNGLFEHGGTSSPLGRIVRHERNLVYGADVVYNIIPGGGYFGFEAEARRDNIPAIIQAFKDVLVDPSVTSTERIDELKESLIASLEMQMPSPSQYRSETISQLQTLGGITMSQKEIMTYMDSTTSSQVQSHLELFPLDQARILIFEGTGTQA